MVTELPADLFLVRAKKREIKINGERSLYMEAPEVKGGEMKLMSGIFLLACAPLAVAKGNAAYPREKVAEFVVEKLDVTSIPPAIGPKREKGKKTFSNYGYIMRKLNENEALVEAPLGHPQIRINVLEESESGIYVCLSGQEQKQRGSQIQRVFPLKLKKANALLEGRESWREFDSCPVIGGEGGSAADGYGD